MFFFTLFNCPTIWMGKPAKKVKKSKQIPMFYCFIYILISAVLAYTSTVQLDPCFYCKGCRFSVEPTLPRWRAQAW